MTFAYGGHMYSRNRQVGGCKMVDIITMINKVINDFVWGPWMLALLVGTGVYLSVRVGFIQVRKFGFMWKNTMGTLTDKKIQDKSTGGISPFQAVATALASTVGTGNITGVATAIVTGGPGAVFWMWISAFFGMITKYSEIVLACKFREKNAKGEWVGGPMYYIEKGLHMKWLAIIFAFFTVFASFGIGNMTQANSIAVALEETFGVKPLITGIVVAMVVALVILGGIKRIATVNTMVVPFMAAFYIVAGVLLLIMNASAIPGAFMIIIEAAFNPQAVFGGAVGYTMMLAIRYGFARGVFSNEAGLGSAPIAHAASNNRGPVWQGLWGIFEVFLDTIVICTISGLVVVISGLYLPGNELEGSALAIAAFNSGLPGTWGGFGVTIATVLFATSTIFGWSYYGEKALEYIFRRSTLALSIYKVIFCFAIILGAVGGLQLIWSIADTLNGLMAIPNLIALLGLSGVVIKTTKDFFKKGGDHELSGKELNQ